MQKSDFKLLQFSPKKKETVEQQSGDGVIAALETVLEHAEAGELSNVVIVATYNTGSHSGQIFANNNDAILMCGALGVAYRDFMNTNVE